MKLKVIELILGLISKAWRYYRDKKREEEFKKRQKEARRRENDVEGWYIDHFSSEKGGDVPSSGGDDDGRVRSDEPSNGTGKTGPSSETDKTSTGDSG